MYDIRWIRENPEAFDDGLARRGLPPQSAELIALDAPEYFLQIATRDHLAPIVRALVDARTDMQRSVVTVYSTMHLWTREQSLTGVKEIANEVRRALRQRLS